MILENARIRRLLLDAAIVAPFIVILCLVLWSEPRMPVNDQVFINYELSFENYPHFGGTLSSKLLVGFVKKFAPVSAEYLDAYIRSVFGALFLIATLILGRVLGLRNRYLVLLLALLVFSRFPLIWLTTEITTGIFLLAFFAAAIALPSKVPAGVLLACCALAKPNSIALGFLLLGYLIVFEWRNRKLGLPFAAAFLGTMLILNLPGYVSRGFSEHFSLSQTEVAFGQHYGALVHAHQGDPEAPNPWNDYEYYTKTIFPGADNILEIALKHPSKYSDFVLLSTWNGIKNFLRGFSLLALPFFFAVFCILRNGVGRTNFFERASLASLAGVLPLILLAYPHIRHLTRYSALFFLVVVAFIDDERFRKRDRTPYSAGRYSRLRTTPCVSRATSLNWIRFRPIGIRNESTA